ncbi:MAG: hypothetical protein NZ703_03645 [Gemmataceae bacterium]|nr:hypothetical protein [Gemmataceae bacterium]MCS7270157.1 hypothetical protein [Gemmataceae bacterium]MDW8242386.1 hypothetical protein [Thermogemmata sp.]
MGFASLTAQRAFELYFLETRAKLLDLAALLDRFERSADADQLTNDPRWQQIRQALNVLNSDSLDKAEQIQMIFSQPYDPEWPRPQPRF